MGPVEGQGIRKMFRSSDPSAIGNRPSVVRPKGQPLGTYRLFRTQNNGLYLEPNPPKPQTPTPSPPTTAPAQPRENCTTKCMDCGYHPGSTCQLVKGTKCTRRCSIGRRR